MRVITKKTYYFSFLKISAFNKNLFIFNVNSLIIKKIISTPLPLPGVRGDLLKFLYFRLL
ncbi:MAG: hypothetical protein A2W77_09875 [Nitrospinae bacterium RIFCSPLOWO2_12_39_16]|nr:MAG: hypothetical protein A2W77_09875 [Nitrospinae bacterium RIFCSPLOWO2_12_39_16]